MSDAYKEYQVTESDFEEACKNASYWDRQRILKKMQKDVYRKARFDADKGVYRVALLPPSNVEEAVKAFVWANKNEKP